MNDTQTIGMINSKNAVILILILSAMHFTVTGLVDSRFREIESAARVQVANQQSLLTDIAETTARNGADAVTESVVRDCSVSDRTSFEGLLVRLSNNLSGQELAELERLFGRCGAFYSERKLIMVARLSREIEVYEDYVDQLSLVTGNNESPEFLVSEWKSLSTEENRQAELFSQLVQLQDEIITTLLSGKSAASSEIVEILEEVNQVKGTLAVTNKQASNIRAEIIPL